MIKELTTFLDYSLFAELALGIFTAVFVAITIRTLLIRKSHTQQYASIVLEETDRSSDSGIARSQP